MVSSQSCGRIFTKNNLSKEYKFSKRSAKLQEADLSVFPEGLLGWSFTTSIVTPQYPLESLLRDFSNKGFNQFTG